MTRHEMLLLLVSEEAAEVSQAISKYLRFGGGHEWPGHTGTAKDRVVAEILDLQACIELCQSEGLLPDIGNVAIDEHLDAKKARIEKYLALSATLGTLKELS